MEPGGPPDVELRRGGRVGYPGVRVESYAAFDPVSVTVVLPHDHDRLPACPYSASPTGDWYRESS